MARGMVLALAAAGLAQAASGDVVERRGAEPELVGRVTQVDDAGVVVRSELGAVHLVPWDRVRRVDFSEGDPGLRQRVESGLDAATDLWRARSRVERQDTTLAEPLLERLFERYRGQTNETALVVAEGLLRCRVARAEHALAVVPALEVARLRRAGVTTESYSTLPQVFDPDYALCTVLAPVWVPSPLLESVGHDLERYDAGGDEVVAAAAWFYRDSIRRATGGAPSNEDPPPAPEHPGLSLLERIVRTQAGFPAEREQLRRQITELPGWAEAWAHYAIGVSLLDEAAVGSRQQGAVHLVHLPARFGRSQSYLAALALARAAEGLAADGDQESAAVLRAELRRSYPNHPLHDAGPARGPAQGHEL